MAIKWDATLTLGPKPKFRGYIHRYGFYIFIMLACTFLYFSEPGIPRISFAIYLLTVLNMYGTSSILHITPWATPALEEKVQKLDHASIFLLIAGSYTPLCLSCLPPHSWALYILTTAWMIALAGVFKCLVWLHPPKVFNVAFYFLCGLTVVPFIPKIYDFVTWYQLGSFIAGGAMYLCGGVIYATECPDPFPKTFGYHEIFHTLTIIANLCFFIPMTACVISPPIY